MRTIGTLLTLRELARSPLRTGITLTGVALGVSVVLAIETANRSTLASVENMVRAIAGETSLTIHSHDAGFDEDWLAAVADAPGVKRALPLLEGTSYSPLAESTVLLLGVDILADAGVRGYELTKEASLRLLARPNSLVLSQTLARRLGLDVGDEIELLTPQGSLSFLIIDLLDSGGPGRALGGNIAIMDLESAQFVLDRPGIIDRIDIAAMGDADPAALRSALEERVGGGLVVEEPRARVAQARRILASFHTNLTMVSLVALLVGAYLVLNTMTTSVIRRRREIGILRALGLSRDHLQRIFAGEALLLGSLGALLGIIIGELLALGAVSGVGSTVSRAYLLVEEGFFYLSPRAIVTSTVLGIFFSLVASALPSREAARTPPALAMRRFETGLNTRRRAVLFLLPAAGLIAVAVGAVLLPPLGRLPIAGYGAGLALLLGVSLLVPGATLLVSGSSRRVAGVWGGIPARLGVLNLGRSTFRSSLAVAALMAGLSLVICVGTLVHCFKKSIEDWVNCSITSDLVITSGSPYAGPQNVPLPPELREDLKAIPGVRYVNAFRLSQSKLDGETIALASLEVNPWLRENPLRFVGDPAQPPLGTGEVIVSGNLSRRFNKRVGDMIELPTPSGRVAFTIAGVFLDYTSELGAVFIDLNEYRRLWGDNLVDTFDIYLTAGASEDTVRRSIETRWGRERQLHIMSHRELRNSILADVDETFRVVYALLVIALVIALMGVVNTLAASLLDRRRELGVLRAVGATSAQVARMVVVEGAMMGLVGALTGLIAGTGLSVILLEVIQFQSTGWDIPFHLPVKLLVACLVITPLLAASVGYLPARWGGKPWVLRVLEFE